MTQPNDNELLAAAKAWCEHAEQQNSDGGQFLAAIAVIVGLVLIFGVLHLSI